MPLSPIGDIASGGLTEQTGGTVTWETATDWDNAVSESGVVHESVANTDHSDETTVKMGYSFANPELPTSLDLLNSFHEDSGSTAYDYSGNNNDGSIGNSPTLGATGLLGTSAYDFPNQGYVDLPTGLVTGTHTVVYWINENDNTSGDQRVTDLRGDLDIIDNVNRSGNNNFEVWDTTENDFGVTATNGTWFFVAHTLDAGANSLIGYVDAVEQLNTGFSGSTSSSQPTNGWSRNANTSNANDPINARLGYGAIWNRVLTQSELQTLYDVVASESSLTTATKSFPGAVSPNLDSLSYSLNGESITIDVIGSPGTASEEVVSQTLDGSTSYTLSWSSTHTDFRVKPRLSTANPETTPTVGSISLTA